MERLGAFLGLAGASRAECARRLAAILSRPVHRSHITRILAGSQPTLELAAAIEILTEDAPGGAIRAIEWVRTHPGDGGLRAARAGERSRRPRRTARARSTPEGADAA